MSGGGSRSTGIRSCFANDELLDALFVTLQVAAVAVARLDGPGPLLGLGLARLRFRGRGATETLLLVPMVTPEIVMGLSLLLFFLQLFDAPWLGRPAVGRPHHVLHLVRRGRRPRAGSSMNPQLEEAARDLGASAWGAFRYVTLPLIAPAVLAGALLAFSLSFDDYVVTTFNSGRRRLDAAALHLRRDQVRRHAGDQRDLDDHRRGHGRRDPDRLAGRLRSD